jgi:hypothetical protein
MCCSNSGVHDIYIDTLTSEIEEFLNHDESVPDSYDREGDISLTTSAPVTGVGSLPQVAIILRL